MIREIQAGEVTGLPRIALAVVECLAAQLDNLERQPMLWHRVDETSRRLETISGGGIITATALAARIQPPQTHPDFPFIEVAVHT